MLKYFIHTTCILIVKFKTMIGKVQKREQSLKEKNKKNNTRPMRILLNCPKKYFHKAKNSIIPNGIYLHAEYDIGFGVTFNLF